MRVGRCWGMGGWSLWRGRWKVDLSRATVEELRTAIDRLRGRRVETRTTGNARIKLQAFDA
jgi:hypothetical protein